LGKQIGQSNDCDGEMLELILEIIGWGGGGDLFVVGG